MEVSAWPNLMKYDETLDIEEFCDFRDFGIRLEIWLA